MFILSGSYVPATPYPDYGGGSIALIDLGDAPATPAPFGILTLQPDSALATEQIIAIPSYTGDTIALPTSNITAGLVTIPGNPSYVLAEDSSDPQSGEFVQSGNTVTVHLRDDEVPAVGTGAIVSGVTTTLGNTDPIEGFEIAAPHPALYGEWNIEKAQYRRSFEGHPSASFEFMIPASDRAAVLAAFRNRNRVIGRNGLTFEVEGLSLQALPPEKYGGEQWFTVSLNCGGVHAYQLAQPFKLINALPNQQNTGLVQQVSIAVLANLAALSYQGDDITVTLPRDVTNESTTTLDSVLGDHVRLIEGFAFYSNPDAVETRPFGATRTHLISPVDVLGEVSYAYNGKEMQYQGVQLDQVYKNTVLSPEFDEKENEDFRVLRIKQYFEPKDNPAIPPAEVTDLRETGKAFDVGGITKTQKEILQYNDTIVWVREVVWGFAFAAIDVYYYAEVVPPTPPRPPDLPDDQPYDPPTPDAVPTYIYDESVVPGDYWIPVRSTTTAYKRENGYLVRVLETGTRTARLKTESNNETLTLDSQLKAVEDALDADPAPTGEELSNLLVEQNRLLASIDAYRFNYVLPANKTTEHDLSDFGAYYPDTPAPGSEETQQLGYVPPRFALTTNTSEVSIITAPDPEASTTDPRAPVTSGKIFKESHSINVSSTIRNEEAFVVTHSTQNSEGTNLRDGLRITETLQNKGRPSPHDYSSLTYTVPNLPPHTNPAIDATKYKYLLNVPGSGYTASQPEQGSANYPTEDPEKARIAAEVDLAINNSQRSLTCSMKIGYRSNLQEGDIVIWQGDRWVVFDVGWDETMQATENGAVVMTEGMSLGLGRYLRASVEMTRVPLPKG